MFRSRPPVVEFLESRRLLAVVAVQADGKILTIAGSGADGALDFAVTRYTADGALDRTFGSSGTAITDFGGDDYPNAIAIDSLGRIVVAGRGGANHDFAVARYTTSGSLDATFSGGKRLVPFGYDDEAFGVAIAPDNKVILGGTILRDGYSDQAAMARLNADGTFDATFGTNGVEPLNKNLEESVNVITLASDGKILIAGGCFDTQDPGHEAYLQRLLPSGAYDSTFHLAAIGRETPAVAIVQPSPKLIVAASGYSVSVVDPNGTVAATLPRIPLSPNDNGLIANLLVTGSDSVVVAKSRFEVDRPLDWVVASYKSLDARVPELDPSFGTNGMVATTLPGRISILDSAALDPKGRIIAAGSSWPYYSELRETTLTRYDSTGHLDSAFGSGGVVMLGRASISGRVFNDKNANGIFDSTDAGISGFRVFLDQAPFNGILDPGELSRPVSAAGTYTFSNLPAGTYRVREVARAGWRQTTPPLGYYEISLAVGQVKRNLTFANTDTGLIKGSVFMDSNRNRKFDFGEVGLPGWCVFIDRDNDGRWDRGEQFTTTDARGNYRFLNLSAGTYILRVAQLSRYTQTTPMSGSYAIRLPAAGTTSHKDFGQKRWR